MQVIINILEEKKINLDNLQFIAVGGAKVPSLLLEKAIKLNLPVYQGYGLSEAASVVAVNTITENKLGSVGKFLPHVTADINNNGELILQNPAFLAYVGNNILSQDYATGDLIQIDNEGFIFVNGRKRNVIITSNGRNISPEWLESELAGEVAISQSLVVGEARDYLCALIVSDYSDIEINKAVFRVNKKLPEYARIRAWIRVNAFTPYDSTLTPNGRLVRTMIEGKYQAKIDELYRVNSEGEKMDFFTRLQQETQDERQ